MSEHKPSTELTSASFDDEPLTISEVRSLESEIVRRVALRFLTPEERSSVLASGERGSNSDGLGDKFTVSELDEDAHDSDPHDSDPHDKDIHDRGNFDRDNFDRV